MRFISSLDLGLFSAFAGRLLLIQIHFPRLLILLAGETEVGNGMEFEQRVIERRNDICNAR